MNCRLTVYEPVDSMARNSADSERFERSIAKLSVAGICVNRVICADASALSPGSEAHDLVSDKGMGVLPITVYDRTVVFSGSYPDDQTLADYLDVPDGMLSVDKKRAPNVNDLAPGCACGVKSDSECK